MDDELITALIAAIEAARTDGEGQILADHLKARINAAEFMWVVLATGTSARPTE